MKTEAMDVAQKVAAFFARYPTRTYDKRELLARAEEQPDGVMYIQDGRVSQYDITPSGGEVVVNIFKPGAFFPMSWAMNGGANHYFYEASIKTTVHLAPPEDVVRFLQDNPDVTFNLLSRVFRGADGLLRRMAHLMGGDAKTRLLFELLNAAGRFGRPQANGAIFIPLKEGELARHSGLARETVSRIIQNLKESGLVAVEKGGIAVPSVRELEAALGTDV